jgi:outer membrane lipoprotein-sorting protein
MKHLFLLTLFLITGILCFAETPDFTAILSRIDEMGTFDETDFSCQYTVVSEKPGEERSIIQLKLFRRDSEDKFLLLILKPEVQKGEGYLQVGDNSWSYDPESRKFAHFSMKENFQDSEAKNNDFKGSSLVEDYDITFDEEGQLGRYPVYILTLQAKNDEVSYPKLKLWVRKDNSLLLKIESYSLSDRLMRMEYYPGYVQVGDKFIPTKILFIDCIKEGEKTEVTIKDHSVAAIPDSVFTKRYLERVNH